MVYVNCLNKKIIKMSFICLILLLYFINTPYCFAKATFPEEAMLSLAKSGNADAAYNYGIFLIARGDAQEGLFWLKKSANNDFSSAQNRIATYYEKGQYVEQDYKKAFFWHKKAALHGNASSIKQLIALYKTGTGTKTSLKAAYTWAMIYSLKIHPNSVHGKENIIIVNAIMEKLSLEEIREGNSALVRLSWQIEENKKQINSKQSKQSRIDPD